MIKSISFLFLSLSFLSIKAQDSADTVKHFGAGIVIGGVGGYAAHKIFNGQRGWIWAGAVGSSLVAGLAKETLYDQPSGASWEQRDVLFTAIGGVVSALALEVFLGNSRRRGGRGKNCGCLVTQLEHKEEIDLTVRYENGTGDITSELQAAYYFR
ncbi:hypothetical protein [Maribacter sp. ACAM166]|uniref:hypothetical protein n=1 Tax=Maribacter sp. ACAM166 TaxID=2508996 RepID=UPI0010FEFB52|nr:hypothetical protein [Maribacter sp. ACAM166]TLP81646.1 hypothetical protein ES765_02885 [Maribacter sp. ACAM166]